MQSISQKPKKVLIAYKFMPQYRIDFFNRLKEEMLNEGIELSIVYGKSIHADRNDEKNLEWALYRENKILRFAGISFYWQPITDLIRKKDLVIVEQASSLIINYYLILCRTFTKTKLGFWGHGRNRQGKEKSLSNRFKKMLINKCDHWFAYSKSVERYLLEQGYPQHKISIVNNSFDTLKLNRQLHSISESEKGALRKELNIEVNDRVAIYCGALYKEKRLEFLLESADLLRSRDSGFKLIIVGSGSDVKTVEEFAATRNWVHYAGARFDREKALYFSISDVFLMPGAVGLAVLDSFALETPMVLCTIDIHGPEVDYLVHGENAVFSDDNIDDFTSKAAALLNNSDQLQSLKRSCIQWASEVTLEKMLIRFINGIKECLYEKVN